ncbi:MAG TPA: cell division protein FtsA, partial [Patescibacteria group bacterium]|nr:cell division protein FtsA [Patescibacteria group bacterium]
VTNLRNIERSLSDLGIERSSYVFSGLASSLSTLSDTEKELGVVTVDIGGGKTDVCMYVDGALSYSSSIPMGARHITNDIAVGLRVSLDSAEKIKLFLLEKIHKKHEGHHSLLKPLRKDDIDIAELRLVEGLSTVSFKTVSDGIIKPRLDEIFEKVFEEIEKSGFFTMVPSGLVITGGGAQTIGVVEVAKKVIGLSARIGVPQGVTGLVDEVMYPPFAAVVGLILYGNEKRGSEEKMHFKDFGSIFRNFSVKGSFKKVTDLFKSFLP